MFLTKDENKSKYWQIIYKSNGKRSSKSTGEVDKNEAEKILELFKQNYSDQELNRVIISKIENQFLLEDFIKEYETFMQGFASESYLQRSIKPALDELLKFTGNIPIKDLSARLLETFLIKIFKRSKYTAANYYRTIKSALSKAQSWNYIDKNYLKEFKLPKIQKAETLFIGYDELEKIVDQIADKLFKNLTLFAFFSGLRAGEIVTLTWRNIQFDKKLIQVGSAQFQTKSKTIRYIPISEPLNKILLNVKPAIHSDDNFVFSQKNGKSYKVDYVSQVFRTAVRKTNLNRNIHFHTLRSSFGSYLLQKGVPIQMISKLLGHSSIAVTEKHYASLTMGNLFDAVKQFNSLNVLN